MIVIRTYNPDWPLEFDAIRQELQEVLGPLALQIDHIGSTSVPGLGAKDIIDVQVSVSTLDPILIDRMVEAGYVFRPYNQDHVPPGEDSTPAQWSKLYFVERSGERPAHIHVRAMGNLNQRYALLFRDYLRAHPNSAAIVERIKRALAHYHPDDEEAYYDIKDPVYDLIWEAAKEWSIQGEIT